MPAAATTGTPCSRANETARASKPLGGPSRLMLITEARGVYHRELGELESAKEYADRARELAPLVGPWVVAQLLWLDARIAVDQQQHEEAEELLREAIRVAIPVSTEAAALATVELVRVLLLQDRREAARETAETMTRFVIPLEEKSPAAAAAVLDLVLFAQNRQRIDLTLIDRVSAALEPERVRCESAPAPDASRP